MVSSPSFLPFEVPNEFPVRFVYKKSRLKAFVLLFASLTFFCGIAITISMSAGETSGRVITSAVLLIFGVYFFIVSMNYFLLKVRLTIDLKTVQSDFEVPFRRFSIGNDYTYSFQAPTDDYVGFSLLRSPDVDASQFTLVLVHASDEKKNVTLYNSVFLRKDRDPQLIEKFKFFQSKLGLPLHSSNVQIDVTE